MEEWTHASLYALIAVAAWTHAREAPQHRVIAGLFGWCALANVLRLWIDPALDAATVPYAGSVLGLYYLDHALFLSFRFALLAACFAHFVGGSPRLPLAAFGVTFAALVLLKETTGASLLPLHAWVAGLTLAACWAFAIRAVFAPHEHLEAPDGAHAALLLLLAGMLVNLVLNYAGPVEDTWVDVRRVDLLVHGGIAAGYLGVIVRDGVRRWRAGQS